MNPFYRYQEELRRIVEQARSGIKDRFVTIEKELKGIQLPEEIAIVDIETTGLDPKLDEIVSYGIVKDRNKVKVVARVIAEEKELLELLKKDLNGIKTVYAFYVPFERDWLTTKLGDLNVRFEDLKRMDGRLIHVVNTNWGDDVDGSQVPKLWQGWKERLSFGCLSSIIHHNLADLMRETFLFLTLWNDGFDGCRITEKEWTENGKKKTGEFEFEEDLEEDTRGGR